MYHARGERLQPLLPARVRRPGARSRTTTSLPHSNHARRDRGHLGSADRVLGARSSMRCGCTSQHLRPSDGVARERRGNETQRAMIGRPRGYRSFAASSTPRRARASAAFELGAEVLPAGQLDHPRYSLSGPGTNRDACQPAARPWPPEVVADPGQRRRPAGSARSTTGQPVRRGAGR